MKNKFLTLFFLTFLLFNLSTVSAQAVSLQEFDSCLNPKVSPSQVNSGTDHGVIGSSTPYAGVDTIYSLEDGNTLQCLCTTDGKGIQTFWLKVSSLEQQDVEDLENQGWTYAATGAVWGLQDTPYLAKNTDYSCKTDNQSSSSSGGSQSSTNSSSSSTSSDTGSVLGLAATGSMTLTFGFLLASILSLIFALFLRKFAK